MGKSRSGVVVRWHGEKGFGFIKPDDGGDDCFCHVSAIEDDGLNEGAEVTFELRYDERQRKDRVENLSVKSGGPYRGPAPARRPGPFGGAGDRYDDRRGGGRYEDRYDDRRGGGRHEDRYDDRRGGGRYDERDDYRGRDRYDDRGRGGYDDRRRSPRRSRSGDRRRY